MAEDTVDYMVTFEEYGLVVKQMLQEVCHDSKMNNEDAVYVEYATPPLAFAKFVSNVKNGQHPGPLVSFYLSDIEEDSSVQMGGYTKLTLEDRYEYRAPVIVRLTYTVTINSLTESQADLIMTQIMKATWQNRCYATKLNGQWVTITSSKPVNKSSVETGDGNNRAAVREIQLVIDRAYLDFDIGDYGTDTINQINFRLTTIDGDVVSLNKS